jgi:hypothetical protein
MATPATSASGGFTEEWKRIGAIVIFFWPLCCSGAPTSRRDRLNLFADRYTRLGVGFAFPSSGSSPCNQYS